MSSPKKPVDDRVLTVLVIPAGSGEESRTLRIPYRRIRAWAWVGGVAGTVVALMLGTWWFFAVRSLRVGSLETELAGYELERDRVAGLASQLEAIEADYARLRAMFTSEGETLPSNLWLPPAAGGNPTTRTGDTRRPTSWPLTEAGFLTQGLHDGAGDHPGIDIAVPADSYVRAAGGGTVAEVGEDRTYGNYVIIDHGQGLTSLYGHASLTLVEAGRVVRQNEVIALSGTTGRSTAPHLHFEIMQDGEPLDPLELVHQP